jgi:restriction system protein
MTIPDYQTVMLPLLQSISDGQEHSLKEAARQMAEYFKLTPEECEKRIPSGNSTYIKNRTGWARTYLKKAGLLHSPQRGAIQITDRGKELLSQNPLRIDNSLLEQYPEFIEFKNRSKPKARGDSNGKTLSTSENETPEETIERSYTELRSQLADELLDQIKRGSPEFFEQLVVDVIVAMGYGGSHRDAAQATQKSNDGGIDGIIKQDRLGLDTIYIQAKKWDENRVIHRPEIQKFAGALQGVRARKGIFITTSSFSEGACEYAETIDTRIILIDGLELCQLMIDYGVGVTPQRLYEIKDLDSDYFEG